MTTPDLSTAAEYITGDDLADSVARAAEGPPGEVDITRGYTERMLNDFCEFMTDEQAHLLFKSINDEALAKRHLSQQRLARVAEANDRIEFAANESLYDLQLDAVVPLDIFNQWEATREKYGESPWTDDEFWQEAKRDNPEIRVKNVSRHIIIAPRWSGVREGAA
jgi:hypothetical protein